MNRNLTLLFLLMLGITISINTMAQRNMNRQHAEKQKTSLLKNSPPLGWYNSSRDVLFFEDFSDDLDGWTIAGEGVDNWQTFDGNSAGGNPPEALMWYNPPFEGTSRLISPVVNTSGYSNINLSFLHAILPWNSDFTVGVETTSDGGTTWNEVWSMNWTSTSDYAAFEVFTVTTPDVGSANFQFCFKFDGNSQLIERWYIDNVALGDPILKDVATRSIIGLENQIYGDESLIISSQVNNYGSETVSFDVKLSISEGTNVVFESTKQLTNLAFNETAIVNFDPWITVIGDYTANVTTMLAGDEFPANDQREQSFTVYNPDYYCIPGGDCTGGDGINDFTFAGIENLGSGCSPDGYGNFTNLQGTAEIGSTYTASIKSGYNGQIASIWIDFNHDLVFSPMELILTDYEMELGGTTYNIDIIIPENGTPGLHFMRVGVSFYYPTSPDACATLEWGEWEDYSILITGNSTSLNAGVTSINMVPVMLAGNVIPKATIVNDGIETISFPVTCTIPGTGYTSTIDVSNLEIGQEYQATFAAWPATVGVYNVQVQTYLTGDENPGNDMLSKSISIAPYRPDKKVVGEEGTGTWCGWCPRGAVYMDSMAMKHPDTWIGIAVHNSDPMVVDEYDAGIAPLLFGYPGGLIERALERDPSNFENAYYSRMTRVAPATLAISDIAFNAVTNGLTFTLTSEFVATAANFRFNAVLTENGVTGTGAGWAQANNYSGGTQGPMGGFENLPNPVPAEDMEYNHVARAILGGFAGAEGSLPDTVNQGETFSYTFNTTIPADWDVNNIEIVGMLIDQNTGFIENGATEELVTGMPNVSENKYLNIYPNPARNLIQILNPSSSGNVFIYNINGQLVAEMHDIKDSCTLDISNLENGTYIINVVSDKAFFTSKVTVIK